MAGQQDRELVEWPLNNLDIAEWLVNNLEIVERPVNDFECSGGVRQ